LEEEQVVDWEFNGELEEILTNFTLQPIISQTPELETSIEDINISINNSDFWFGEIPFSINDCFI